MADGIKGALQNLSNEITQAVIKPVSDEVGKAVEVGAQSVAVAPPPIDPKVVEKKREDVEKRKQNATRIIEWNQQLSSNQAEAAKKNQEQADYYQKIQESTLKGNETEKSETDNNSKAPIKNNAALDAMNSRERRKGVGG